MGKGKAEEERKLGEFGPGDTVKVHYKIKEGDKVRTQPFRGIVIAKKGRGLSKTFTVRRVTRGGFGIERIFPLYSPSILKIEVLQRGKVRRAKLYYLRQRVGKEAMKVKLRRDG